VSIFIIVQQKKFNVVRCTTRRHHSFSLHREPLHAPDQQRKRTKTEKYNNWIFFQDVLLLAKKIELHSEESRLPEKHEKPGGKKILHKPDWLGEKMKAVKNELLPNQCIINKQI